MDKWQKEKIEEIIEAHGDSGELRHKTHFTGSEVYWLEDSSGHVYYHWVLMSTGEIAERHSENPNWWWVTIEDKRDPDKETDDQFLALVVAISEEAGCMM